jgi:hypothetical protein
VYAPSRVAQRIDEAQREFGITLEYHSIADVEAFEDHLKRHNMYTLDQNGAPSGTQQLTQFEHDWILNEQLLVSCDARYALTRYCYLKDDDNFIHRFDFRVPQRIFFDIISDLEASGRTLEFIILKARQLGMSTLVELLIGLRIIFGYGVNAVIGSADQTKTAEMARMIFLLYSYLPIWLRPQHTRKVESDRGLLAFGHSQTSVSFQHGAQMSGIARGTTPTIYHLSEVATYTDAENQIESSLLRAVHASPNVFGALESSGEGDKGWWPDRWRSSRDFWAKRAARHCPLFLPWFCGVEMYPKRQWIDYDFPMPSDWRPNQDTRQHVAKCELYVESTPALKKHLLEDQRRRNVYLGPTWRMPIEQQWFWEFGHEEAKRGGTTGKWYQEMCADDEEALQRSITSVFGHQVIQEIESRREKVVDMFCIVGQSIEADHEPPSEYIDYARERIPVRYTNIREESYRWELVPLLERQIQPNVKDPGTATGILFIWAHPQPGVRYSIGVDTAAGQGEDSTAISVWAIGRSDDDPDTQVAEFASAYVNHVEAFAFVLAIAAYYKTYMDPLATRWKEPYVSIEQLASVGDVAQLQMAKMGYSNFHMMSRYDDKNPQRSKKMARKRGWFTNTWSRQILTTYFVNCARNLWLTVNSPWLLEEMKTFEAKVTATGRPKLEHEEGKHDDRVFAAAMACFCPHDLEAMAGRSKKRPVNPSVLPPLNLQPSRPSNVFSPRDLRQTEIATVDDLAYEMDQMERYR